MKLSKIILSQFLKHKHPKYIIDKIFGFVPVKTITAKEEAHGIKPVKMPTVSGFCIFELVNLPWSCPQSLLC